MKTYEFLKIGETEPRTFSGTEQQFIQYLNTQLLSTEVLILSVTQPKTQTPCHPKV